ncbi:LOW QUALITY PROTEIN: cytosolic endo-beta-N-acetylglucosaminidase-like [Ornithodoros turicata]|uniref:LOW QUALITY PROTEIN: cytosolic endo-beta-N-acetylglucosaminidase-like n=1 Tax=Ornithodoros turicata TaxID=34597 RepID=UPI003138A842
MGDECAPLHTLRELLDWKSTVKYRGEPLKDKIADGGTPKTLLCHDMMGGYLEDRFVNGSKSCNSYRFYHWDKIDVFVYFSHHLVTIPPVGWINAAHRHNVKVLGTFITEWDAGSEVLERIKRDNLTADVATRLADIAHAYGFDGWLMNIESTMADGCGAFMEDFLSAIASATHRKVEGSMVLWYDSFIHNGELKWQNELNDYNKSFFNLCDGIFLNYGWTAENLEKSAEVAGKRKADVYVGIDVFARNTEYPGGFETCKSVEQVRKLGLSAAIFAPGWVYETQEKDKFTENQCRFWNFPKELCRSQFSSLPIVTSFCQGFGRKMFEAGKIVSNEPWFNLSKQQLQPVCQSLNDETGKRQVDVCTEDAFYGGGSLRIHFSPRESSQFRLFSCNVSINDNLRVCYTLKPLDTAKEDNIFLVLVLKDKENCKRRLLLGSADGHDRQPREENVTVVLGNRKTEEIHNGWITRNYVLRKYSGFSLNKICLGCDSPISRTCLLGQMMILPAKE